VPYGTDSVLGSFQAINCLATFIRSLRDKNLPDTCPQNRRRLAEPNFEDEDEDDDEDEDENDVLGVINRQRPTANGQPQTANGQPQTANGQPPTANRKPQTANRSPQRCSCQRGCCKENCRAPESHAQLA
jgi:hypothetical protein